MLAESRTMEVFRDLAIEENACTEAGVFRHPTRYTRAPGRCRLLEVSDARCRTPLFITGRAVTSMRSSAPTPRMSHSAAKDVQAQTLRCRGETGGRRP